jgi:hypothetical protein
MALFFLIHFCVVLVVKALHELFVFFLEACSRFLMLFTQIIDSLFLLSRQFEFLVLDFSVVSQVDIFDLRIVGILQRLHVRLVVSAHVLHCLFVSGLELLLLRHHVVSFLCKLVAKVLNLLFKLSNTLL